MHQRTSTPTLHERVAQLAGAEPPDADLARDYLNRLVDRHAELGRGQRTAALTAVTLVSVFVMLSGTDVSEADILGVKVTDFTLILALTPPAVVGLAVRSVSLANAKGVIRDVYSGLVEAYWPKLHSTKLHHLLLTSGLILSTGRDPIAAGTRYDRIQIAGQNIESFLLVFVVPTGFTAYAYGRLFDAYGPENVLVWLSALATGVMLTLLILTRRGPEIYPPGFAPEDGPSTPAAGSVETS